VADAVVVVAKAMPVNRSIKAIPNNIPWFLVIVTEMFTLFFKKTLHVKKPKSFYNPLYIVILGWLCTSYWSEFHQKWTY
jgi:hypothetical protein